MQIFRSLSDAQFCRRHNKSFEARRDKSRAASTMALGRIVEKDPMPGTAHVSLMEALSKGPPPVGNLAVPIFMHGSLEVEMYTPVGIDPQKPHDRDEVYLIARGVGVFFDGLTRRAIEAGTFLFVAAGQPHRFEEFSPDFACWVFFYGPPGGEDAA